MPEDAREVEYTLPFEPGRKRTKPQPSLPPEPGPCEPALPRIAHLVALAIKLDTLLRSGVLQNYTDIARFGHVSRARVTQIMNLLYLAPDIQEELLFLPSLGPAREILTEAAIRKLACQHLWEEQRRMFLPLIQARNRETRKSRASRPGSQEEDGAMA
jgi:hypothetical protein